MVDKNTDKEEIFQAVYSNPVFEGKVTDWESFRRHQLARQAWNKLRDQDAVLKNFTTFPPRDSPPETTKVRAFYVRHHVRTKTNNGVREIAGEGPMVLLADSVARLWDGSESSTIGVESGQKLENVKPVTTRVIVGPVRRRTDLITGKATIVLNDQTKVEVVDHDAPVPPTTVAKHVANLMERRMTGKGARGTIRGESGDRPVLIVGVVGNPEDVSFFPPGKYSSEPSLKVKVVGNPDDPKDAVSVKLPLAQTQADYAMEDTAQADDYREVLPGEPVACNGRLSLFGFPVTVSQIEDATKKAKVTADIKKLVDVGLVVKVGEVEGGAELLGINLLEMDQPWVQIGPYKAYDVRQEVDRDSGKIEWKIYELCYDKGDVPRLDCIEHPFVYRKGDRKGEAGVMNAGAFVLYLTRTEGAGAKLNPKDALSGITADLPGFDEI